MFRYNRSKYGNVKTECDGFLFASKTEASRWQELKLEQIAGQIVFLKRQVRFELKVKDKLICTYIADFVYNKVYQAGTLVMPPVVEDRKGKKTEVFKLKAKLFEAIYGYPITITYDKRSKRK